MLYSLTKDQLYKLKNSSLLADFTNAEMLIANFKTDPVIAREILPKPLIFSSDNMATVFVAKYPETNFGCVYNEGALFLNCEYKGERGFYCLSMPVDDDMALIGGREQYGYPKKMAQSITLEKKGEVVVGQVIRKNTEILKIECHLSGEAPEDFMGNLAYLTQDWDGISCIKIVSFLFKYFPSPCGSKLDFLPRLIREPVLFRPDKRLKTGTGKVTLTSTINDPLAEIAVGKVTNMFYGKFHNTMLPGKVVARVWNLFKFAKHAFFKTDFASTLLEQFDADKSVHAKKILKIAKKY